MSRRWGSAIGAVVSGAALAIGGVAFVQARADEALLAVPGRVLDVQTDQEMLVVRSNSANHPTHETEIRVRYAWTVDGKAYEGTQYAFDRPHQTLTEVDEVRARIATLEEGAVEVLVSPDQPSVAVLSRRDPTPRLLVAGFGLGGLIVCLVFWVNGREPTVS